MRGRDRRLGGAHRRRTAMAATGGGSPPYRRKRMNLRRRMRELINGPGLTLMPGVYDALSARIVEAAGFETVLAGGYAAIGSMMAQADSGQSNVRDYADHYARICDAVSIPLYVDADTGFGGV